MVSRKGNLTRVDTLADSFLTTENPPPYTAGYPPPQVGFEGQQQGYPKPQQGYVGPQAGYPPPQQPGYGMPAAYAPPPPQQSMQQQSNTTVVIQQPGVVSPTVVTAHVPDYTVSSILACLCCFPLTGLLAIYFAQRSRTELVAGDVSSAQRLAANARNMIIVSVICGLAWIVITIVVNVTNTTTTCTYDYDC